MIAAPMVLSGRIDYECGGKEDNAIMMEVIVSKAGESERMMPQNEDIKKIR